jgi:hypothetical protein
MVDEIDYWFPIGERVYREGGDARQ